jgi:hypothetical protein
MYDSPLVMITYVFVSVAIIAFVAFSVVVTIGGIFDLLFMFRELKASELDETDDGRGKSG